jgi:hypothetical protein
MKKLTITFGAITEVNIEQVSTFSVWLFIITIDLDVLRKNRRTGLTTTTTTTCASLVHADGEAGPVFGS